ncbi:unnamed protein product [Adineta steineri]|uniref:Carbonic anhydrase n=1 Tax=Adineta steineri TaxID=433720 RepID=A0A818M6S6_9BILA|nr:unnamed protein product [Adineta steineri]CAF3586048.1 unnamed protein product [Adineta steineri]
MPFVIFNLLYLTILPSTIVSTWNYGELGPDVWSDQYPLCIGHSQSPIDIKTACTIYQSFIPFHFSEDYNNSYNFTVVNNGHTILTKYSGNILLSLTLTGGGLNGTFEFLNFHLHWGENYKSGSEHQINGEKYAGEIHFVYINPQTYQLAVLGIFMQTNPNIHTDHLRKRRDYSNTKKNTLDEWEKFFSIAGTLQQTDMSVILRLNLAILMGTNLNDFWRYRGSLTVPPCTEDIIWTVFKAPIVFTENELNIFRKKLFFHDYRNPQPLYNRTVYRNFVNEELLSAVDYNCCSKSITNRANTFNMALLSKIILLFILVH